MQIYVLYLGNRGFLNIGFAISTVQHAGRIFARKGKKSIGFVTSAEKVKQLHTVMCGVFAIKRMQKD